MRSVSLVAALFGAASGHEAASQCCVGACKNPGEEKYWSIAKGIFGGAHCGECCMDPKKYGLFHFFEKNLTKSVNTVTPCADFGYTVYDSTPTHGFGPVSMTLDLYNKPKVAQMASADAGTVLVTGATGRMGALMYQALKAAGLQVRALTRTADRAREVLGCQACDESEGIYLGDVTDKSSLGEAFKGVDTVVIAVGAHGNEDEATIKSIEWTGVKSQMEELLSGGSEGKRVMLFSSMSTTPAKQHNKVLYYKAMAEAYIVQQGVPFTIVKPCGLSEDDGNEREILVGHDDTEPWFGEGFYMIPRADVVAVSAAALTTPPSDKVRFDICSKLPGSGSLDIPKILKEAAAQPWQPPTAGVVV